MTDQPFDWFNMECVKLLYRHIVVALVIVGMGEDKFKDYRGKSVCFAIKADNILIIQYIEVYVATKY